MPALRLLKGSVFTSPFNPNKKGQDHNESKNDFGQSGVNAGHAGADHSLLPARLGAD